MKFVYEYRTSDNARHTGIVSAVDRDAAYAVLKSRGIKPGRLSDAPGFFNKFFGKGKRWIAIGVLSFSVVVSVVLAYRASVQASEITQLWDHTERRQLIGDAGEIEKGMKTGWRDVFSLEGDRFLACFAIPGTTVAIRNVDEAALRVSLEHHEPIQEGDSIVVRQIKSMVEGMKLEISGLISSGWTMAEVGAALVKRQEREISYYNQAKREVDEARKMLTREQVLDLWEERNAQLRQMGIRLVQFPE